MSRKITYLVCFALLVCLVGSVSAQPYEIYKWSTPHPLLAPGGGSWADPNSWVTSHANPALNGITPTPPPNRHSWHISWPAADSFVDSAGVNSGVINVNYGYCATPFRMVVGANRWANFDVYRQMDGSDANNPHPDSYDPNIPWLPPGVLNVYSVGNLSDLGGDPNDPNDPNGYGFRCYTEFGIGHQYPYAEGIVNIYGTAYTEGLRIAQAERALGTLNIHDGGNMTVGWWGCWLGMDMSYNRTGTAMLNLKGNGSLLVRGDPCTVPDGMDGIQLFNWTDANDVNFSNSHIDIEGGTITVWGNHVAQLQNYVDNGWLTSYGGTEPNCDPNVFYIIREWDDVNYPGDLNDPGDPNFDPNAVHYTYVQSYGDGCTCKGYFDVDLNQDCYVNGTDFSIFAADWLKCTNSWDAGCLPYITEREPNFP